MPALQELFTVKVSTGNMLGDGIIRNPTKLGKDMSWLDGNRGGALVKPAARKIPVSRFSTERNKEMRSYSVKSEGTCEQGQRADLTGCTPASGDRGVPPDSSSKVSDKPPQSTTNEQASDNFKPAATREEAEEYVKRFSVGKVSYRGIDLSIVNDVNKCLTEIYASNPKAPKLYGIEGKKFNDTRGMLKDAMASYAGGSGTLYINTAIMGSVKKLKEYHETAREAERYIRERLAKGDLTDAQKSKAERMLSFDRQIVDGSINGIITHEFGHHIDWKILLTKAEKDNRLTALIDNWQIKAKKISARASDNALEYIAESFVAYRNGEAIDTDLKSAFQRAGF